MAIEQDTASVCKMLRQRQKEMLAQKEEHLKHINHLSEELQRLFDKAPKKPRGSIKELEDEINALEFKRTTSSLSLAEEKEILRQIDALSRTKIQCVERKKHEETIQEKKAEMTAIRESLSLILASIDELAPVLAKVELADKLKCATTELTTITIDCPKDKARHVIGKNGSNIKQIMERTSVAIDVDSDKGKVEITGSQAAVDLATKEIKRITEAVEEDVTVPPALVEYLTARRLTSFADFREQYSDVFVDVTRNRTTVHLEGLANDVTEAKEALLAMDVKQESRSLTNIEAAVVVGKKGVNVNRLVDEHKVTIDVENSGEDFVVSVIGPSANVENAVAAIEELLELNKDVTESVPMSGMARSILLNKGGAGIKKLQKDVNEKTKESDGAVFLNIDRTAKMEDSALLIKARRPALGVALGAVQESLKEIMNSVVTMQIDPFVAPRLIGKGGTNIKKLKSQGDGVIIEIDKAGKVEMYGSKEDVEIVKRAIQAVVDENQVERLDVDPAAVKLMYRALIRDKSKEINSAIPGCDLDDETSQIVLRGNVEQIKLVTDMITEFMANNYIEEVSFAPEDETALLMGGSACFVHKTASDFDIDLSVARSNHVIVARGEKGKVLDAKKKINQFLHGGDGHAVSKIVVSEQAVGSVIGKGGTRRMELEDKHEGVRIFIERTNGVITLRGPDQAVQDCRTEILKIVTSVRVQESMPLSPQQHTELSKPDVVRKLTGGIPVHVTVTETEVIARGIFTDVRDAIALLKAHLTGVYETRVQLDSSQYLKISAACRDPSHFNRMKETAATEIALDPSSSSIVIRGKRGAVKKAKLLVMDFLDFLLPSNFEHIKMPKAFQSTVASAASLADTAAVSGASVVLDRDLNSILVQSSNPERVKEAVALIKAKMAEAEKLVFVLSIDQDDSWLIPAIIGKSGQNINSMSKETGSRIEVLKQELTITITGEDEETVVKAKTALFAAVDKARRECVFIQLPSNAIPAFIGKSGAHIRQFADERGVEVERVRKDPSKIRIGGQEDSVSAAKAALLDWVKEWEENNAEASIPVEKSMFGAVLGKDGSKVNAIQKDTGCRIDIDRSSLLVIVRGSSSEKRNEAIQKIKDIIAQEQAIASEREQQKVRDAEERAQRSKAEKKQTVAAATDAQPIEDALDTRKDRATEFSARPVGLTPRGKEGSKANRKQHTDDAPLVGTAAGRSLFNLLVADSSLDAEDREATTRRGSLPTSVQHAVSSDSLSNGDDPAEGPVYVKSACGFAVRV